MDNLYIDYEQGVILGTKIQGEAKDLSALLKNIKDIQEELQPILNDSNDEKYLKAMVNQTQIVDKLVETIEETGNFLVNVSNAYSDAANTNYGRIN